MKKLQTSQFQQPIGSLKFESPQIKNQEIIRDLPNNRNKFSFANLSDRSSVLMNSYVNKEDDMFLWDIPSSPINSPIISNRLKNFYFDQENYPGLTQNRLEAIQKYNKNPDTLFAMFMNNNSQSRKDMICVPIENTSHLATPFVQIPKASKSITIQSEPKNISSDDSIDSIMNENELIIEKTKKTRGLKNLSVRVRDIVSECQWTTYKEVAEIILRDFVACEQLNENKQITFAKEEQNIKRRVYDALIVLISAEILVKDGKRVKSNQKNHKIQFSDKLNEISALKHRIVSLKDQKTKSIKGTISEFAVHSNEEQSHK